MKGLSNIFGLQWFYKDYWSYLFSDLKWSINNGYGWYWPLKVIWCRIRNHPYGVVYYSSGMEPDMSCKNCCDETERF